MMDYLTQVRTEPGPKVYDPRVLVKTTEPIITAFQRAGEAMQVFARRFLAVIETEYLQEHKRLPGSLRTSRLRKKRGQVLARWFRERYTE